MDNNFTNTSNGQDYNIVSNNMNYTNNANSYSNSYTQYPQNVQYSQTQMYAAPAPQPKKKRTGLIIGIIAAIAVIAIITVVLLLIFSKNEFIGTWTYTEDKTTIEIVFTDDDDGYFYITSNGKTQSLDFIWKYNKDTKYLTITALENLKGETASMSFKVLEIDGNTMIVEMGGQTTTLTKISD